MATFEGVALSSVQEKWKPELWTFRVDPPVEGLPETVEVFIERSVAGDEAACWMAGPELMIGAIYEVTAGQWPGNSHLNVSLYVGSYRLIAEPPATSQTTTSSAPSDLTKIGPESEIDSTNGWVVPAAIVAATAAIAALAVGARRSPRRSG